MLLGRVGTSSIPMVAGGAGKMDGRQPFQITGIYPHNPTGLIKDCAHNAHDLHDSQEAGIQVPRWSRGGPTTYMVPGGHLVGLHGPRGSTRRPTLLQGSRGSIGDDLEGIDA